MGRCDAFTTGWQKPNAIERPRVTHLSIRFGAATSRFANHGTCVPAFLASDFLRLSQMVRIDVQ
jgi:hypothetical protein